MFIHLDRVAWSQINSTAMMQKLKEIGLWAAIILLIVGLAVMGMGFEIINRETTDPSGIESFFNFLGGGFIVLLGGGVSAIMLTALIIMAFVEIAQRSGTKGVLIGVGVLFSVCVLMLWLLYQWGSSLAEPYIAGIENEKIIEIHLAA